jgi:hypothetical protein
MMASGEVGNRPVRRFLGVGKICGSILFQEEVLRTCHFVAGVLPGALRATFHCHTRAMDLAAVALRARSAPFLAHQVFRGNEQRGYEPVTLLSGGL